LGIAERAPLLIITGSIGAGKTTVLGDATGLLCDAKVPHAAIDLDWLTQMFPDPVDYGHSLMMANLAAIWPIYVAAGAQRLLVARALESRSELEDYRRAVPHADVQVCRLLASIDNMAERVRRREIGSWREEGLARSAELARIQDRSLVEDFTINNEAGRNVTELAREVLARAGWL